MLMLAAALLAQAATAAAQPPQKPAGHVGVCAWGRLERADRDKVLDAYDRDRSEGLTMLMSLDAEPALRACAPPGNVVSVFLHKALWAEMTQVGAARAIAASGVDRAGLDAAWTRAPAARACLHARLGPTFGQLMATCTDDAEGQIAAPLNIQNERLRLQASIYYVAKAEGEWAEILIANSPF